MQQHVIQSIEQGARDSAAGLVSFGAVVGQLIEAGVESYHADYRAGSTCYYLPDGETHSVPLSLPSMPIPAAFDVAALQAAIRGAQRGEVKYPEFVRLTTAAGCVGYIVWIAGRHVSYFGRQGEVHVEPFPAAD